MPERRTAVLWLLLLPCVFGAIEVSAAVGLVALERFRNLRYEPVESRLNEPEKRYIARMIADDMGIRTLSAELGWTNKPDSRDRYATITRQGIRGRREYELARPPGITRLLAFGDSYTHASEVRDEQTFLEVLREGDESLEVLNFGVAGYGLDQAYLRYERDGAQFEADVVLIGFMSENISRSVNVFRPFYLRPGLPASKPRFVVREGGLGLIQNPLRSLADYRELLGDDRGVLARLGERDYFYARGYRSGALDFLPSVRVAKVLSHELGRDDDEIYRGGVYDPDSEAFDVTTRIIRRFYDAALGHGSEPVVLLFPHPGDFETYAEDGTTSYGPLLVWLEQNDVRVADLIHAFDGALDPLRLLDHFVESGHYNAAANAQIGSYLRAELGRLGLLPVAARRPALL